MLTRPKTAAEAFASWRRCRGFMNRADDMDVEMRDWEELWANAHYVVTLATKEDTPLEQLVTDEDERRDILQGAGAHNELEQEEDEGWPAAEDPPEVAFEPWDDLEDPHAV